MKKIYREKIEESRKVLVEKSRLETVEHIWREKVELSREEFTTVWLFSRCEVIQLYTIFKKISINNFSIFRSFFYLNFIWCFIIFYNIVVLLYVLYSQKYVILL